MAKIKAKFPSKIWDGSSPSTNVSEYSYDPTLINKSPDPDDWAQLVQEVIALQSAYNSSAVNLGSATGVLDVSKLSGVISTSHLGSGSPSSSNYLRGDGSWSPITLSTLGSGSPSSSNYLRGDGSWNSIVSTVVKTFCLTGTVTVGTDKANVITVPGSSTATLRRIKINTKVNATLSCTININSIATVVALSNAKAATYTSSSSYNSALPISLDVNSVTSASDVTIEMEWEV